MNINYTKRMAREAGILYLLLAITSIYGLVYVPSKIVVKGNIIATINQINTMPVTFKLGIISNLVYLIIFVFLVLAFYQLLKEVNKKIACIMVALVLVAIPIAFLNELNKFFIFEFLNDEGILKTFDKNQQLAMVQLFLNIYNYGSFMVMLFWGLWLFPLGFLVINSQFIPKTLGYLLMIGGLGYLCSGFFYLISPEWGKNIFPIATIPSAVSEVSMILWLLIKGSKDKKPESNLSLNNLAS